MIPISNPNFINSMQTSNIQQNYADKTNLQTEFGSFESYLNSQLSNSKYTINNTSINKMWLNNNGLNQLLISILKQTLLEHGSSAQASTNACNLISYNNKAHIYSENQNKFSNATSGEYNKAFDGDVFLGDSITTGLSSYKFLDDSKVYAKVGIGTNKVEEMVESAAEQNPKRVFIMSGINDVGSYNKAQFTQHYTDLINTVKEKCPNAKIYVQSILPVLAQATQKNPSLNNDRINEFNSAISQISKDENVVYLNTSVLVNRNENIYASDGIHYKPAFYPTWMNFLQTNAK